MEPAAASSSDTVAVTKATSLEDAKDSFKYYLKIIKCMLDYNVDKINVLDELFMAIVNTHLSRKHGILVAPSFAASLTPKYKLSVVNGFAVSVNSPFLFSDQEQVQRFLTVHLLVASGWPQELSRVISAEMTRQLYGVT